MKISIINQEYEVNPEDIEAVQNLVRFFIPEPIKELVGMLTDSIKGWRAQNMVKVLMGTKKLIDESGLSTSELSGKFFVQAIEKASVEDNDSLQIKWATLIANASTGKITQDTKFISILSELNENEVKILDVLHREFLNDSTSGLIFSAEKISTVFGINISDVRVMIDNFYRLNICQPPASSGVSIGGQQLMLRTNNTFTFTDLGKAFVWACTKQF